MSRYLTPSKVCLLALAQLYTEGVIANSATTSILSFLISHILHDSKHNSSSSLEEFDFVVPIKDFETSLSNQETGIPGRTVYDLLLKKLWTINCSDALDSFINSLPSLLSKSREQILKERETGEESDLPHGQIQPTSPLGAYIRRCHLEYTRLQFEDSLSLWQDFVAYRASTRQTFEKKNALDGQSALDVNLQELQIDVSHPLAQIMYGRLVQKINDQDSDFSAYDAEKLMEFQVSEMQRLGGRLPNDIRSKLTDMLQAGLATPKLAHYLRFLDSWRAGDFASAYDHLHRYFDYTMQNRDRTFYQYALLNLAILQADFGCHAEAIPAMQEAIATARENKDTTCLNFCMSWLYHFGRSFPSEMKAIAESGILGSENEGLAFLKSRAKDAEMWTLLSTAHLSEAKLGLQHGDSLASVFENIVKAAYLNVEKSGQNVIGATLLMKSATFGRIGLSHLAWSCGETFLECHAKDAPIEDILKCTCRMASLQVQQGRYNEAEEIMSGIPSHILRVLKYQNFWSFHHGLLKLQRHLHRDDLDAAEYMTQRLLGQGQPDLELGYSLALLAIELHIRRGNLSEALKQVESLAEKIQTENNDVLIQTRLLNLKARILAESNHPLKGFSIVLRAAQIAYRSRILPNLWQSIGILANILNQLREFAAASDMIQAVIPQVLECQDCDLAARTYSYLSDAHMGLASLEDPGSTKQKELVSRAMEHIDSAYAQFRYIEDLKGQLEMLSKKATIMHWRGDLVLANDTATQFLELKKQYADTKL